MRFALYALALMMASPAVAMELQCYRNGDFQASCSHPLDTSLPYDEIHMDAPGTYDAFVKFATPLTDELSFAAISVGHFDIYNPAGELIDGNTGLGDVFLELTLPKGFTSFGFRYEVPDFRFSKEDDYRPGSTQLNDVVVGSTTYFDFNSPNLPRFSFSISKVENNAVPEPATWAMMLIGFGLTGSALRSAVRRPVIGRNGAERLAG